MGIRIWGVEITAGDILIAVMGSTITAGLVTVGLGTDAAAWYAAALASGSVTLFTLIERQKRHQVRQAPRAHVRMFQHMATTGTTIVQRRPPTSPWSPGEHNSILRVRGGVSKSLQHKGTRVVATYDGQVTVRVFHPRDPQVHALSLPPRPNDAYAEVETATGDRVLCRVAGVGANAVFLHVVFQGANDS